MGVGLDRFYKNDPGTLTFRQKDSPGKQSTKGFTYNLYMDRWIYLDIWINGDVHTMYPDISKYVDSPFGMIKVLVRIYPFS